MATLGERVATLEEIARSSGRRLRDIEHVYHGGGDVEYDHSVRGRLHAIETALTGLVVRRNFGLGLLKGWERAVLVFCGVATAAAAWYAALGH